MAAGEAGRGGLHAVARCPLLTRARCLLMGWQIEDEQWC